MNTIELDAKLIDELGGPAKVARLLSGQRAAKGGTKPVTPQMVCNWKARGISAYARVEFHETLRWPPEEQKREVA